MRSEAGPRWWKNGERIKLQGCIDLSFLELLALDTGKSLGGGGELRDPRFHTSETELCIPGSAQQTPARSLEERRQQGFSIVLL